jgi:hypothetical protein
MVENNSNCDNYKRQEKNESIKDKNVISKVLPFTCLFGSSLTLKT